MEPRTARAHAVAAAVALIAFAMLLSVSSAAHAYNENVAYPYEPGHNQGDCYSCHMNGCGSCHSTSTGYNGPHGGYTATSRKCEACHTVHDAPDGIKLLAGATINASCGACHDGTGGNGVYGSLLARGATVGAAHRVEVTDVIPGGSSATGGSLTRVFRGEDGHLTCTDCHSPHAAGVVAAFYGDRLRSDRSYPLPRNEITDSSKLLKRRPTGGGEDVADYGSGWCLACHGGRDYGGAVHNHPVESPSSVAVPYVYRSLPVLNGDGPTSATVIGQLGGRPTVRGSGNRGYLMPYPRTPQQSGHYPLCQQCHEDSRDAGDLSATGVATALASVVTTLDGNAVSDNPRFQNFPHETANAKMLVENADDLCTNCHPVGLLP